MSAHPRKGEWPCPRIATFASYWTQILNALTRSLIVDGAYIHNGEPHAVEDLTSSSVNMGYRQKRNKCVLKCKHNWRTHVVSGEHCKGQECSNWSHFVQMLHWDQCMHPRLTPEPVCNWRKKRNIARRSRKCLFSPSRRFFQPGNNGVDRLNNLYRWLSLSGFYYHTPMIYSAMNYISRLERGLAHRVWLA